MAQSSGSLPLSWEAALIVTRNQITLVLKVRYGGGLGMKPGSPAAVWCGPGLSSTGGWVSAPHTVQCFRSAARPIVWLHLFPGRLDVAAPSSFSGGSARLALGLVL